MLFTTELIRVCLNRKIQTSLALTFCCLYSVFKELCVLLWRVERYSHLVGTMSNFYKVILQDPAFKFELWLGRHSHFWAEAPLGIYQSNTWGGTMCHLGKEKFEFSQNPATTPIENAPHQKLVILSLKCPYLTFRLWGIYIWEGYTRSATYADQWPNDMKGWHVWSLP